jgi:hypothetical protein
MFKNNKFLKHHIGIYINACSGFDPYYALIDQHSEVIYLYRA